MTKFLTRSDLVSDPVGLARQLLGSVLVHETAQGRVSGLIVETEAYVDNDAASHAFRGKTARNGSMFLAHGHAYVYRAYGISWMLNVASGVPGQGTAVLLRAAMPVAGLELMAARRGVAREIDLARGPGRLAQAFAISPEHDGLDLCAGGPLRLVHGRPVRDDEIGLSPRIGITRDADRLLRFYLRGNRHVSGPRWLSP